jgi:hypothetical protein
MNPPPLLKVSLDLGEERGLRGARHSNFFNGCFVGHLVLRLYLFYGKANEISLRAA